MKKILFVATIIFIGMVSYASDYSSFKLDNGQNVVIQEVHDNPIVIIDTFVKAITDINPSVSRYTVEFIKFVDDVDYLYKRIIEEIGITLSNIDETVKNRSYVQNKKNFNLYWNLEAIVSLSSKIQLEQELTNILLKTALSNDYTIREKTAKVASLLQVSPVLDLLKDDENVYVKKYLS